MLDLCLSCRGSPARFDEDVAVDTTASLVLMKTVTAGEIPALEIALSGADATDTTASGVVQFGWLNGCSTSATLREQARTDCNLFQLS